MDDQDTCLTEPHLAQYAASVSRCTLSQVAEESAFHAFSTAVFEHLCQPFGHRPTLGTYACLSCLWSQNFWLAYCSGQLAHAKTNHERNQQCPSVRRGPESLIHMSSARGTPMQARMCGLHSFVNIPWPQRASPSPEVETESARRPLHLQRLPWSRFVLSFNAPEYGSQDSHEPRILAAIHFVQLTYKSEGSFAPVLASRPITALRYDSATCKANCHHGTFQTRYTLRYFTDCYHQPLQGWIVLPQGRHWSVPHCMSTERRVGQPQSCQLRHSSVLERCQRVTSKDLWTGRFAALRR